MPLITNIESYRNELLDEIKLFYPNFAVAENINISHNFFIKRNDGIGSVDAQTEMCCDIIINNTAFEYRHPAAIYGKQQAKTFNKLSMYKALVLFTGRTMPWGSLTGIRPTKLAYDMIKLGESFDKAADLLMSEFLVSESKAAIIKEVMQNQSGFFPNSDSNILLYIHIPFCKTICSYCSFTAEPVARNKSVVEQYVKKLIEEINHAKNIAKEMGRMISAVYIGGGTPTSIDDESFKAILASIDCGGMEFTCEAGRPDTITKEKVKIMKRYGVNRLCVNPQTLNESTLKTIGRSHSAQDFFDCYDWAKTAGMDINVDLIAGLPNETFEDFLFSLNAVIDLRPQNVTVHTLSIKNGAELKDADYGHHKDSKTQNYSVSRMIDFAYQRLTVQGYGPYYLYRQKHMAENLENIGYCQKNKQNLYNIASMEESLSVLACGAGGISKMLYSGDRIERLANLRDIRLYIEQSDERLTKKRRFFLD